MSTIELICEYCDNEFIRDINLHNSNIKRGRKHIYCSAQCASSGYKKPEVQYECLNCETIFSRKYNSRDKHKFCSRKCSTSYNKPIYNVCSECGKNSRKEKCWECSRKNNKSKQDYSLQELKNKYSISQYHAKIRGQARLEYKKSNKPMICFNCGYSLHVDICHIKDVKDFSLDTKISVVNHIDNLVALDKRCHWEFDNRYLKLDFNAG